MRQLEVMDLAEISRQAKERESWNQAIDIHGAKQENTSGLSPLGHAVLVVTYEPEVQAGKIHIPESVKQSMQQVDQRCVVIAVGPHCWADEPTPRAKPGDRVLVTKFAGFVTNQTKDGQTYRLVNDRDIFCKLDWE